MKRRALIVFGIVAVSFLISVYFYPQMPEDMVSHWGFSGEPDGSMSKFWGVFLFPVLLLFLSILFLVMPSIDPLRKNIVQFRRYFDNFIIILFTFMVALQLLVIFWNLGMRIPIIPFICIWIGGLFYYVGVLVEHAKKNWFIGIRNPWTMSSEKVWDKTHKLGGKMFKVSGIIALVGAVTGDYAFFFVLGPAFFSAFYTMYFSYKEYQKEMAHRKHKK